MLPPKNQKRDDCSVGRLYRRYLGIYSPFRSGGRRVPSKYMALSYFLARFPPLMGNAITQAGCSEVDVLRIIGRSEQRAEAKYDR